MARLARLAVPGQPHVLLQHAHAARTVCRDEADGAQFHQCLGEVSREHGVALHAYAITATEMRLLGTPRESVSLSRMMQGLGRRYGAYFNRRYGEVGSLWAGRFRATVIDAAPHLLDAMLWVEGGESVLGGEVAVSSSRAGHLGLRQDGIVSDHPIYWALGNTPFEREWAYRQHCERGLGVAQAEALVGAVRRGWPLGGAAFIASLEGETDRRLQPLRRGRKPKQKIAPAPPEAKPDPI